MNYPPPPGGPWYPGAEPPRRRRGLLIAAIAAAAVLVAAVLVAGVLLMNRDSDSPGGAAGSADAPGNAPPAGAPSADELRATAQSYMDAINNQDEAAATKLTCQQTDPGVIYRDLAGEFDDKLVVDKADVTGPEFGLVTYKYEGSQFDGSPLFFEVRNGSWCVKV